MVRPGPAVAGRRTDADASQPAREASGPPRKSKRRAVSAGIDRIAEAFLAIAVDSGRIADANPAAGALLGTTRDGLLEVDMVKFLSEPDHEPWWTQLDAVAEGAEPRRFASSMKDCTGEELKVEVSVTRFAKRRQTLALLVVRTIERG